MPNWKKVITSGSNAHLNQITASNMNATNFIVDGTGNNAGFQLAEQGRLFFDYPTNAENYITLLDDNFKMLFRTDQFMQFYSQYGGYTFGSNLNTGFTGITTDGGISASAVIKGDGGISGSNGTFTGTITAEHLHSTDDIEVGDSIFHSGDTDTKIAFTGDVITFTAGDEQLLQLSEGGQDQVIIGDGGDVDFHVKGGGSNTLFVQGSSQKVGIGTNTPGEKLEVVGNISGSGTLSGGGLNINGTTTFNDNSITNVGIIDVDKIQGDAANNVAIELGTGGITFAVEDGDTIDINEGDNQADTQIRSENVNPMVYVDASADKVGIGTSTPQKTLTVAGEISSSGDLFVNNITASAGNFSSHITASGDISSSGTITADNYDVGGIATAGGLINTSDRLGVGVANNLTTQIGKNLTTPLIIKGNITASGNISGSTTSNIIIGEDFKGITANSQILLGHQETEDVYVKAQISHHTNTAAPVVMDFLKSRGTLGSPTVVSQGDYTGTQRYWGYDGDEYRLSAAIRGDIDAGATVGNNVIPGALNFLTTTNGSLQQRMFIASTGNVGIGGFTATSLPPSLLTVAGDISSSADINANQFKVDNNLAISYNSGYRFGFKNTDPIQFGKLNNPFNFSGNITASNNISASGDVIADALVIDNHAKIFSTDTLLTFSDEGGSEITATYHKVATSGFGVEGNGSSATSAARIAVEGSAFITGNITSSGHTTLGNATNDTHTITGHITASGNISASGNLHADTTTKTNLDKLVTYDTSTGQFHITASSVFLGSGGGSGGAVDSIVAGDGIDISGATGDVTITAEDASTTNPGVVELATTAETTTGTDTARAVTPDGLKDGYEGSTNVTTLGTITTGTWTGTAIASANLDSDTAHLTTDQTFTGNKTFSAPITASVISSSGEIFCGDASNAGSIGGFRTTAANANGLYEAGGRLIISCSNDLMPTIADDCFFTNAGNSVFTIKGGEQRVGINKTTPGQALEVVGNITASGTITSSGINIIGSGTGELEVEGHITASGNISASGTITSLNSTIVGTATVGTTLTTTNKFEKTGTTDAEHQGDVVYFGGTTSMDNGKIYHYKSDGTWELANADAVATSDGLLGVALGAASDTNGMLLRGTVTLDHDPGAVGDVLFISGSGGNASATAPALNNNVVRVIGYCLDASNGQIWFNPSSTFVEVSA